MICRTIISTALMISLAVPLFAFQQQREQENSKGNGVVKLSVTLVQVDAVVTDNQGRRVTDLKAGDFEIIQNNRSQQITNFSYIETASEQPLNQTALDEKKTPAGPLPPPVKLKPEQVRRTIALVVDDLALSFESAEPVRQSLKKFVAEQMLPGDLVAVIRTGAGMGALQQFTNDKQQLYAAIERVRWKPNYGQINTFTPVTTSPTPQSNPAFDPKAGVGPIETNRAYDMSGIFRRVGEDRDVADWFRREVFAVGTLGALSFLMRGLSQLPGRKSVVLFSDGLRIYNREENVTRVQTALDNLVDLANRCSVSVYTVDARGLQWTGSSAADDLAGDMQPNGSFDRSDYSKFIGKTLTESTNRKREFIESQEGLYYLADKTGGAFTRNTNDLNRGIRRALQDQEGYYLIGFVPDESTFKSKNGSREFQNISVKVKRAGLHVRSRAGFFGVTDQEALSGRVSQSRELLTALASPFGASGIKMRMTAQFWHDPKGGAFVNAMLYIDARDLTFEETVNGWRKTSFEIAAFTFGDNGQVIDQSTKAYNVSMSEKEFLRIQDSGIFYRINLPIKKPGAYQLRTAVRDNASRRLGSANQFIQIPDVKKGKLALSGLMVRGVEVNKQAKPEIAPAGEQAADTKEGRVDEEKPQASPAVRKFQRGMALEYGYIIYNATVDKKSGRPDLQTQLRLYRDGKLVYAGKQSELYLGQQTDYDRLAAGGSLLLGRELEPGEYALQVVVFDRLAKEKDSLLTQWIDFEIAR